MWKQEVSESVWCPAARGSPLSFLWVWDVRLHLRDGEGVQLQPLRQMWWRKSSCSSSDRCGGGSPAAAAQTDVVEEVQLQQLRQMWRRKSSRHVLHLQSDLTWQKNQTLEELKTFKSLEVFLEFQVKILRSKWKSELGANETTPKLGWCADAVWLNDELQCFCDDHPKIQHIKLCRSLWTFSHK